MPAKSILFRLHAFATVALFGLIWIVQLVHYPGFAYVAPERWAAFHAHHTTSITVIVLPLMVTELALGGLLWKWSGWDRRFGVLWALAIGTWVSTFLLSVPLHEQIAAGYDSETIEALVRTNWPRTVLWTVRVAWLGLAWSSLSACVSQHSEKG